MLNLDLIMDIEHGYDNDGFTSILIPLVGYIEEVFHFSEVENGNL